MAPVIDLTGLALTLERAEFVARCPFPLLYAVNEPVSAAAKQDLFSDEITTSYAKAPEPPLSQPVARPALYPVRKVNTMIPHGIIIGRSNTSDIVIADQQISKAHAMLQSRGSDWELADIGSSNGTSVNQWRLTPRGPSVMVRNGDILAFGYRTFFLLDAGTCWDRIRASAR